MPFLVGLIPLFSGLFSGLGAAITYFVSKYGKLIAIISAFVALVLFTVNAALDALYDLINTSITVPPEVIDFYNLFFPENFLTVIQLGISIEVAFWIMSWTFSTAKFTAETIRE